MSPVKRFFLIFFGVYFAAAILWAVIMGPPGLSGDYRNKYKDDHDRYLQIVKSDPYKIHMERPHLHPADEAMQRDIAFVEEYTAREEFQSEQSRIWLYDVVFSVMNALAVAIIAVRFGRKPLLNLLDEKIGDIRERLDRSESAREEAASLRAAAEEKIENLDAQRKKVEEQTGAMIDEEKARLAEGTRMALEQLDEETEARKRAEERRAAMLVKQELVSQSIDRLAGELQSTLTPEDQDNLFNEFLGRLERHT